MVAQAPVPVPDYDALIDSIGDVPIQFWVCPVREHRKRVDENGGPVVTVEWRADVAYCTAEDCEHNSSEPRDG
jgi:hypothetical protein